jgi:hypothetical protein
MFLRGYYCNAFTNSGMGCKMNDYFSGSYGMEALLECHYEQGRELFIVKAFKILVAIINFFLNDFYAD